MTGFVVMGLLVLGLLGYAVYVQFTKQPSEASWPKRVVGAIAAAFGIIAAAVAALFSNPV